MKYVLVIVHNVEVLLSMMKKQEIRGVRIAIGMKNQIEVDKLRVSVKTVYEVEK